MHTQKNIGEILDCRDVIWELWLFLFTYPFFSGDVLIFMFLTINTLQHCQRELTPQNSEHTSLIPWENAHLGQSEIDEIKEFTCMFYYVFNRNIVLIS